MLLHPSNVSAADDMVMLGFLDIFGNGADLTQQKNYVNIAFHSLPETQAGIASSGREAGDFIDWRRCCQLWLVQVSLLNAHALPDVGFNVDFRRCNS